MHYLKKLLTAVTLPTLFVLAGCENHDPVAVSECPKLVKHSQGILKALARPTPEMMAECKKMSDEQRGCVKNANIVHDLVKCADM